MASMQQRLASATGNVDADLASFPISASLCWLDNEQNCARAESQIGTLADHVANGRLVDPSPEVFGKMIPVLRHARELAAKRNPPPDQVPREIYGYVAVATSWLYAL